MFTKDISELKTWKITHFFSVLVGMCNHLPAVPPILGDQGTWVRRKLPRGSSSLLVCADSSSAIWPTTTQCLLVFSEIKQAGTSHLLSRSTLIGRPLPTFFLLFPTFSYFFKIFLFIPIFAPKFLFFPIFSLIWNKTYRYLHFCSYMTIGATVEKFSPPTGASI